MADKSFGVKELNLIGASGTPTITSPNSVNINATNVAISTDITVGGMVSLGAGTSISSPGNNVLTFGTNNTEKVRITSGGDLKIGSNTLVSPNGNADNFVIDTGDVDSGLSILSATTGRIYFGDASDAAAGSIRYVHTDNSMRFEAAGGEKLRITSDGNVGIGSEIPGGVLDLYHATSNTILNVKSGDAGTVINLIDNSARSSIEQNGTSLKISSDTGAEFANSDIRLQTDGSTRVLINSVGDVLLGGLTSKNDGRNAKGITLKSPAGISFQNYGSNGSRNWRIRPDDLSSWGSLEFSVSPTDNNNTDWPDAAGDVVLELQKDKDVVVSNGNLVIGTNGQGIDFSANSNTSGATSELLDDYEEGTFEPTFRGASGVFNTVSYHSDTGGRYTKVGNLVMVTGCVRIAGGTLDKSNISSTDTLCIGGLPFNNNSRTNGDNADNHGTLRVPVWSGSNCPNFIQARQNVNFCNLYFIGNIGAIHSTNQVSQLTNQSMVQFTLVYTSG